MKRANLVALFLLTAAVAQLAGCASPPAAPAAQGRTPAYADGYNDGCESGRASQGSVLDHERRNANRFGSDPEYAKGWSDAFQKCAYEQSQKMAGGM